MSFSLSKIVAYALMHLCTYELTHLFTYSLIHFFLLFQFHLFGWFAIAVVSQLEVDERIWALCCAGVVTSERLVLVGVGREWFVEYYLLIFGNLHNCVPPS